VSALFWLGKNIFGTWKKHADFKPCSKPTKIKTLGKDAISGFAKSAIADNFATLYIFAMLCPANVYAE